MKNSKAVGETSEAIILAQLVQMGWSVSIPFGNNQRYDFIVDTGDKLLKVQCKTAHKDKTGLTFAVSSKNGFTNERRDYHGQIDAFLVYYAVNQKVYLVPVTKTGTNQMTLRLDPLKPTAPKSTAHWASEYELSPSSAQLFEPCLK